MSVTTSNTAKCPNLFPSYLEKLKDLNKSRLTAIAEKPKPNGIKKEKDMELLGLNVNIPIIRVMIKSCV